MLRIKVNERQSIAIHGHGITFRFADFDQVGAQLQEIANWKLRNLVRLERREKPSDLEIDPILGR